IRAAKLRKRDRGIDGEAFFRNERGKLTHVLVSVKSGKLTPAMVRELRGTMASEKETIGAFVCLHEPSKEMKLEATRAGFLDASDEEGPIPRLQFVTVDRIFSDRRPIRAPGVNVTEMPQGIVPDKVPEHEQLSLRLEPPKPPKKAAPGRAVAPPAKSTRRAVAKERDDDVVHAQGVGPRPAPLRKKSRLPHAGPARVTSDGCASGPGGRGAQGRRGVAADYLRGERDDLPEVPGTLRSRLELERAKR